MTSRGGPPSLRDAHLAQTRERLLDAAAAMLAENEPLAFRPLAQRAGVSAPTVYRHFPTQEALVEALLAYSERRLGVPFHPRTLEEYAALLPLIFERFEQNDRFILAYIRAPAAEELRRKGRKGRHDSIAEALLRDGVLDDPAHAARFAVLLQSLGSSNAWELTRAGSDLRGADAGRLVAWAMRALVDAAARDPDGLRAALTPSEEDPG